MSQTDVYHNLIYYNEKCEINFGTINYQLFFLKINKETLWLKGCKVYDGAWSQF